MDKKVMCRCGAKAKLIPRACRLLHFLKESGSVQLVSLTASVDLFLLASGSRPRGKPGRSARQLSNSSWYLAGLSAKLFPQHRTGVAPGAPAPAPAQTSVPRSPRKLYLRRLQQRRLIPHLDVLVHLFWKKGEARKGIIWLQSCFVNAWQIDSF